jgi:hypothetical protein
MELIFPYPSSWKPYRNSIGFFDCSDRRPSKALRAFLEHLKNQDPLAEMADPITFPGGAKALVDSSPEVQRHYIDGIRMLRDAHGFKTFWLIVHDDCAACNHSRDRALYEDGLRQGKKLLEAADLDLTIRSLFEDAEGIHEVK